MWSLYGVVLVGAVSYGRPVGSQHAREYLRRHLFGQRATFQESFMAIGIASIERDINIALESRITVLRSSIRFEVRIAQWSRAVAESERLGFDSRSTHLRLTYFSILRILFSSNYSSMPLPRMDSVAR